VLALFVLGWRLFFYSNDGNEPMHIHAQKGDAEYWLYPDWFEIEEDFEHNLTPRLRREVRRIIYEHFDQISEARLQRQGGRDAG
jgi:hypothetical protein